jgi:hypothetical protein
VDVEQFIASPWKESHPAYAGAWFAVRPAPEYASGEVLMSALYRLAGFKGVSEREVPIEGRRFEKALRRDGGFAFAESQISEETWRVIVNRVLESPKLPNQAAKPFIQMTPVVPDISLYSGSARRTGNSWSAGQLVARMILLGSASRPEAERLWTRLCAALSVGDDDDVWARWLQREFELRRCDERYVWAPQPLPEAPDGSVCTGLEFPAKQFVRDLAAVIGAKQSVTRAQWVSLLGALVRLAAVTHVVWFCDVHDRLWKLIRGVLYEGDAAPTEAAFRAQVFPRGVTYFGYGKAAVPLVRDYANRYLSARLCLNLLLWHLRPTDNEPLASVDSLYSLIMETERRRDELNQGGSFQDGVSRLQEQEARTLSCKKGVGSNVIEFARHVLGQRQSATEVLRGYDQGYFLKKKGAHAAAPWVVSLGPVSVIGLVHCCLYGKGGARSVHRLAEHLSAYGVHVGLEDLSQGDLGTKLRLQGLVLDSPDAESGMLLVPPFAMNGKDLEE